MVKFIIIFLLLASLVMLARALSSLTQSGQRRDLAKRLSYRMLCSVFAFALLILAYHQGWIHPHPLGG